MAMDVGKILEMVLLILIYIYLFPTIIASTYTGTCNIVTANLSYCPFENESVLIKALVGLLPIIYLFAPFAAILGYIKWKK